MSAEDRHRPGTMYACDARNFGADLRLCRLHDSTEGLRDALSDLLALCMSEGIEEDDAGVIRRAVVALMKAGEPALSSDGWVSTVAAFLKCNEDSLDADDVARVRALEVGDSITFGGGAAHESLVRRIA